MASKPPRSSLFAITRRGEREAMRAGSNLKQNYLGRQPSFIRSRSTRLGIYSETTLFGSDVPAALIGFNLVSKSRVITCQSKAVGCGERSGGTDGVAVVAA